MRLNRFYFEDFSAEKSITLSKSPIFHQIKNVLRMKEGELISLFLSPLEAIYKIEKIDNKKIELLWQENVVPKINIKREVVLFQSLIKKDKMEWVVQKAVELGVKKMVPVISERSEKKEINFDRLNKIIIEASEQCGRIDIMEIGEPLKFKEALKKKEGISFIGDASGSCFSQVFSEYSSKNKSQNGPFSIFVGPEGGFSSLELSLASENELKVLSLNNYILRSETASVAFLSLIFNF